MQDFETMIATATAPILVEFYNPTCSHCKEMAPVMDELKAHNHSNAQIVQVDVTAEPEVAEKYHVRSVPTFIIFKDGQEAWRDGGRKPIGELKDMIHRFA